MATDIWQCPAQGRTLASAANEFARSYWDKPRKVVNLKADPNDSNAATFQVEDGLRIYSIYFVEDTIIVERH